MTTDRELLELAAKAAGVDIDAWVTLGDEPGYFALRGQSPISGEGWNPLTDDGDALRLAVSLRISLAFKNAHPETANDVVIARAWHEPDVPAAFCVGSLYAGQDQAAATRRAIVRAASEIGKAMP